MSYASAIDQIRVAVDAISGLALYGDQRRTALEEAPRGSFDGAFVVYSEGAVLPIQELSTTHDAFRSRVVVKVATLISTSRETADDAAIQRGIDITQALISAERPGTDCIHIVPDGAPQLYTLDDKRLILAIPFALTYLET